MLEYVGIAVIAIGIFLLLKGLREETQFYEVPYRETDYRGMETDRARFEEYPERKTEVKGAGVVLIGPIPIVFGESKYAVLALILTIVLMLIVISMWVIT